MPGFVRPPRRPPGWVPPGPTPALPADRTPLGPFDGEDLCFLAGDWRIVQRVDGHRWSVDDLVTAWLASVVAAASPPARILDLGCGIGTVLLLLAWRFPTARLTGIEAQSISVDLARRSIAWNGVEARCRVVSGDLRAIPDAEVQPPFRLITGTPPYLPPGSATASIRPQVAPAHLELRGGIESYCETAARWLTDDGAFVACASAGQDGRVRAAAATAGLHLCQRVVVIPRTGKSPLFSVHVMRRRPRPTPATTVAVRDAHGRRTAAFRAIRAAMGLPP